MARQISRRSFLQYTALAGSAIITADAFGGLTSRPPGLLNRLGPPDLAVVSGSNYYDATVRAVHLLGGMTRFVPRGASVGILVNSRFTKPGTYVKPQIALAVIAMCYQADAAQIVSLEDTSARYWSRATLSPEHKGYVDQLLRPRMHSTVAIRGGVNVRNVEIVPDLLECDVYINIPIFKDHEGIRFTGALKNLMGAIADRSNQTFHLGSDASVDRDDHAFLSQSIADANLLRKPTLSVGDATEVLVQGGPFGPGPVRNFHTVVASTDPVALDACGAEILGCPPQNSRMLRRAQEHGIGTIDLRSLVVVRESL